MVGVTNFQFSRTGVWAAVGRGVMGLAATGITIVIGAQLVLQSYYADRILPGVHVAGINIGSLTLTQARATLTASTSGYRLNLNIDDQKFTATSADLGLSYDVEHTLKAAYDDRRSVLIPAPAAQLPLDVRIDSGRLSQYTQTLAAKIGTEAVDASLVVSSTDIQTVSDKNGFSIDPVSLADMIRRDAAMPSGAPVKLASTQQPARILAAAVAPTVAQAARLMAVPIELTYQDQTYRPSATTIGSWLTFNKQIDGNAARLIAGADTAKIRGYVQQLANTINVAPVDKKVTIENGVSKVGREGVDGLAIDQDPAVTAITKALGDQQPLAFTVTSHAVPFKTAATTLVSLDYGRYVEINLSKQHLWVWQDHAVIFDTPITSGAAGAGFPTVQGLFSIYYKATNTHLIGNAYGPRYNYDVQVDYWMPFYSGYGMHDASWRNGNFGGSDYYYGGSHGCVNLPDDAAAFIYNWAEVGTPVWIHA